MCYIYHEIVNRSKAMVNYQSASLSGFPVYCCLVGIKCSRSTYSFLMNKYKIKAISMVNTLGKCLL